MGLKKSTDLLAFAIPDLKNLCPASHAQTYVFILSVSYPAHNSQPLF